MEPFLSSVVTFFSDLFFLDRSDFPLALRDLKETYGREIPDFPLESVLVAYVYSGRFAASFRAFKVDAERFREAEFSPGIRALSEKAKTYFPKNAVVTSPPGNLLRKMRRGYDPAEVLARSFAKKSGLRYVRMFERTGTRQRQSSLSINNRMKNVVGKFRVRDSIARDHSGRAVVFFDDVVSSGATACECVKALRRS